MKKRLLIGRIIGFLGICIFAMGISYIVTYYLDKSLYQNIHLLVTFEDTKEFQLPSTKKLSEEEALKTYPTIFKVQNKGLGKTSYQIVIKDLDTNLNRSDLDYILFLNEKEVKNGSLSDISDNILYVGTTNKKTTDTYKLYIYLNTNKEDATYQYSIQVTSL